MNIERKRNSSGWIQEHVLCSLSSPHLLLISDLVTTRSLFHIDRSKNIVRGKRFLGTPCCLHICRCFHWPSKTEFFKNHYYNSVRDMWTCFEPILHMQSLYIPVFANIQKQKAISKQIFENMKEADLFTLNFTMMTTFMKIWKHLVIWDSFDASPFECFIYTIENVFVWD